MSSYRKKTKTALFCILFSLSFFSFAESADDRAQRIWMDGYLKLEEAETAEKNENIVVALQLYRDALEIFQNVRRDYPNWHPSLIQYRISFCTGRIQRLSSRVAAESSSLTREELLEQLKVLKDKIAKHEQELQQEKLKAEAAVNAEMNRLRTENNNLTSQLRESQRKNEELGKSLADTKKSLETTNTELARLRGTHEAAGKKIDSLEIEKNTLQAKLDTLTARIGGANEAEILKIIQENQKTLEVVTTENRELKTTIASNERSLAEARQIIQKQTQAAEENAKKLDESLKTIARISEERTALGKSNQTLETRVKTLSDKLTEMEKRLGLTPDTEISGEAKKTIDLLNQAVNDSRQRIAELEKQISETRNVEKERAEREESLKETERILLAEQINRRNRINQLRREANEAERENQLDLALKAYLELIKLQPDDVATMLHAGILLADTNEYDQAIHLLKRVRQIAPHEEAVFIPLGMSLLQKANAREAMALFADAVARHPENADFWQYLGVSCRSLEWYDAAAAALQESFKISNSAATAYNLAVHYATLKQPKVAEAKQWYKTARELGHPQDNVLERFIGE